MRGRHPGQRGQRGHALEGLARALAVHRLEVVEAPGAVEPQLLGELHAAHQLVPRHPLLGDVESESHSAEHCHRWPRTAEPDMRPAAPSHRARSDRRMLRAARCG